MNPKQKAFLEAAGIPVGNKRDFLGLTPAQEAVVEVKVRLSYTLRRARKVNGMTQAALAEAMGVPQQTVARLETIHKSISVELLMRALITAGVSLDQIADEIKRGAAQLALDRGETVRASAPAPVLPPICKPLSLATLPPASKRARPLLRAELDEMLKRGKSRFDDNLCSAPDFAQSELQAVRR